MTLFLFKILLKLFKNLVFLYPETKFHIKKKCTGVKNTPFLLIYKGISVYK